MFVVSHHSQNDIRDRSASAVPQAVEPRISNRLALKPVVSCPDVSSVVRTGVGIDHEMEGGNSEKTLQKQGCDRDGHSVTSIGRKRRRPDSNRGWRICNPLPQSHNPPTDQQVTETDHGGLPSGLPDSLLNDSELIRIISAWPSLSEADRKAVLRIVRLAAGKASGESGTVSNAD